MRDKARRSSGANVRKWLRINPKLARLAADPVSAGAVRYLRHRLPRGGQGPRHRSDVSATARLVSWLRCPRKAWRATDRTGGAGTRPRIQYGSAPVGFGTLFGLDVTLTGASPPAYIGILLPGVLDGSVDPVKVFNREVPWAPSPRATAMDDRRPSRPCSSLTNGEPEGDSDTSAWKLAPSGARVGGLVRQPGGTFGVPRQIRGGPSFRRWDGSGAGARRPRGDLPPPDRTDVLSRLAALRRSTAVRAC